MKLKLILSFYLILIGIRVHAEALRCESIFYPSTHWQWLSWEQKANLEKFQQPSREVPFKVSFLRKSEVDIWESPVLSPEIKKFFFRNDQVLWVHHVLNQSNEVPFFGFPVEAFRIPMHLTSSRSVVPVQNEKMSLKIPTDHVHWSSSEIQSEKVKTAQDIRAVQLRDSHIRSVDQKLGSDPELVLLMDVLTISDRNTGHGILVRDLSPMKQDRYYLPAFSIPFIGRQIAEMNGQSFESFWKVHYAERLGRAKAKLMHRYGLQLETPNPQNMLLEFTLDMKPTGRIFLRDVGDTDFVIPMAQALGFQEKMLKELEENLRLEKNLFPNWNLSEMHFNSVNDHSVSAKVLDEWGRSHDEAYIHEMEKRFQISLAQFKKTNWLQKVRDFVISDSKWPFGKMMDYLVKHADFSKVPNRPPE